MGTDAVNLDPDPWWYEDSEGDRQPVQHGPHDTFHPRPEYSQNESDYR